MVANQFSITEQIKDLKSTLCSLLLLHSLSEKNEFLKNLPIVVNYLKNNLPILHLLQAVDAAHQHVIYEVIACNQGPVVFNNIETGSNNAEKLRILLSQLFEIDDFYRDIGGIIGYHLSTLKLIDKEHRPHSYTVGDCSYFRPLGIDLEEDFDQKFEVIRKGIESAEKLVEIYPIGGAGDRLNLKDESTGQCLPVAALQFLGRSLLEGLVRDLQAREYLYYKLFHKQIKIPIVMMTSHEKNNHEQILKMCQSSNWFGRLAEDFYFVNQPSVPVITFEGYWSLTEPLSLLLKPSGHGVVWKLVEEEGIFKDLEKKGKSYCLVRQINNPIAGTDDALLAICGQGFKMNKAFGFLSCSQLPESPEGIDVIIKQNGRKGYHYTLTNIEYTNFKYHQEQELSRFSANTNILYANISAIRSVVKKHPFPGQLINFKLAVPFIDSNGKMTIVPGGRLESTMQNIADHFEIKSSQELTLQDLENKLSTFIVYNKRSKTISTTKTSLVKTKSENSTPEKAFYDHVLNNHQLLELCGFTVEFWDLQQLDICSFPPSLFIFHPGVGPLYEIIKQKIRGGCLHYQAELQLEIAEVDIEQLDLDGSLIIKAKTPLGKQTENGFIEYGLESRCQLKNVKIVNRGAKKEPNQKWWKNMFDRWESLSISMGEGAEFSAQDVTFVGDIHFDVPTGHRLCITPKGDSWQSSLTLIEEPSKRWDYTFDHCNHVILTS